MGLVRLITEPDLKTGEVAFIVADSWQSLGLGSKMLDYMIEICKDKKLDMIYGVVLKDNARAIGLMKRMGFTLQPLDQEMMRAILNLKEEEKR